MGHPRGARNAGKSCGVRLHQLMSTHVESQTQTPFRLHLTQAKLRSTLGGVERPGPEPMLVTSRKDQTQTPFRLHLTRAKLRSTLGGIERPGPEPMLVTSSKDQTKTPFRIHQTRAKLISTLGGIERPGPEPNCATVGTSAGSWEVQRGGRDTGVGRRMRKRKEEEA